MKLFESGAKKAGKTLLGDWCSPDYLEDLGDDSLHCSNRVREPITPPITLDNVKDVSVPRGVRNHKKLTLESVMTDSKG